MVSELVTNAIKFGSRNNHQPLTLDLRIDDRVRCGVISHGPPFRAGDAIRQPNRWGLKMVADLADCWGVDPVADGTQVWFETRPGPEPPLPVKQRAHSPLR